MEGAVEAILRKYNPSQGAAALSPVAPSSPSHLCGVESYGFDTYRGLHWGLLLSRLKAHQVHRSFMMLHASSLEAKAMICSSGIFHPHAAPGTEMVIELE